MRYKGLKITSVGLFLLGLSPLTPTYAQLNAQELNFKSGDVDRRALIIKQDKYPKTKPLPAIIVLHGGMGNTERVRISSGFDDIAKNNPTMVVYAEGTPYKRNSHAWNTGYLLRGKVGDSNDIEYLDNLIELLIKNYNADPKRIYMTGTSNGAMMTFIYAIHRSEKLAAISPVAGAMFDHNKIPKSPVPILMINGGLDKEVPVTGGFSQNRLVKTSQQAPYLPLNQTIDFWVKANKSAITPILKKEGTITTTTYPATSGGTETISILDSERGHNWSGANTRSLPNSPTSTLDTKKVIWEFFRDKYKN
jgi:polyhydroxybutyrate depolymerase